LWSTEDAIVLLAQGLVLWRVGLYRGLWRFASVPDLFNLAKAALFGMIAIGLGLFLYNRLDEVPRTVLLCCIPSRWSVCWARRAWRIARGRNTRSRAIAPPPCAC
jgi:FlaA1/EpsC-like NDP-sugar epimerase